MREQIALLCLCLISACSDSNFGSSASNSTNLGTNNGSGISTANDNTNSNGNTNTNSNTNNNNSTTTTGTSDEMRGLTFIYERYNNSVVSVVVGHADLATNGTFSALTYTTWQGGQAQFGFGWSNMARGGGWCGTMQAPNTYRGYVSGTWTKTTNNVTLQINGGDRIVFGRTTGSKKLYLSSVNYGSGYIGYGYSSAYNLALTNVLGFDIQGALYSGDNYYQRRGSGGWSNLGAQGLYTYPLQSQNVMVTWYACGSGYCYGGSALNMDAANYGIIYQHFGHDFNNDGCYDTYADGGHARVLYGFAENNNLMGFMALESSYSTDGGYLSISRFLRQGVTH